MNGHLRSLVFLSLFLIVTTGCGGGGGGDQSNGSSDGQLDTVLRGNYEWRLPPGFPVPAVPADNPMSEEKVELGRHLFYDVQLSGNGTQSCSSCHLQHLAFSDGRSVSIGSTGESHPRNSLSLTNVAYNATLNWANPATVILQQQIPVPLFGEFPVELGISGKEGEVLARFRESSLYQALFQQAYPGEDTPISFGNIVKALASFTRTLISGNSPFDRLAYRGESGALSESAQRGMDLFFSERLECFHCHGGFNFTLSSTHESSEFIERPFHNNGLYNIDGAGAYPRDNQGLFEFTNTPEDMGKFRAPSLRNVEFTAPYMHDGSIATLEEVVRHYARGGRLITEGPHRGDGSTNPFKSGFVSGFSVTDQEIQDVVAFLRSLSDPSFLTDERFRSPFKQREGE
ncbi:di-heme enzyme [bacterium]|nr:di-heme enzyme [bacterium]